MQQKHVLWSLMGYSHIGFTCHGVQHLSGRMPDSPSREPGFEIPLLQSQLTELYKNEYLALDSGGNVSD